MIRAKSDSLRFAAGAVICLLRMSPVPYDPFRLPVRIIGLTALAALAALTFMDRGATRMFATPWTWLLAGTLATPPVLLLWRLRSSGGPLRLPSPAWTTIAAMIGTSTLLSAVLSPYQGSSLLAAAVPFAAVCLFFLLHDWLRADERHVARLELSLLAGFSAASWVSTLVWVTNIFSLSRDELLSSAVFEMRNPYPLGHSNYTAGLMLLGLPVLARTAWRSRGPLRVAAFLTAALALLNLFMSGSRGGLLGLGAIGVTGVAIAGLSRRRFLSTAGGAVLLVILLGVANPRIRSMLVPRDPSAPPNPSTVQRTAMIQAAVQMGLERPLLGWGPGSTPLAYPRFRQYLDGGAENVLQLHSTPAQLWAETGAAGLLGSILLSGLLAVNWRRSPLAATTLAGYGVFALTDYQLDVPVFAGTVATLCALIATPASQAFPAVARFGLGLGLITSGGLIALLAGRDPAPSLNAEALQLARDPAQHDRAVALLQKSLALNPDQEIAHFNVGWLLLVPEPDRAEQHFRHAARLVPDKGGVYFGLGLARLNQGRPGEAARAFALECINDPRFLASPWWTVPEIRTQRAATAGIFSILIDHTRAALPASTWVANQAQLLSTLAPRLGDVSPGPETNYRRERIGYPVLMRNLDLAPPIDLYDVREDPRFPDSVPFPLPPKGWLPSPLLLKLLDDTAP
jgi:tetratricopeptide (TPR) repeat protein